jgi:hypothetical protein
VTLPRKVVIDQNPVSLAVAPGASAVFYVGATGSVRKGDSDFQYQWRKDGVAISGANSSSYQVAAAVPGSAADAGSGGKYDVVVSNEVNTVTSLPATLTV